jgi:hypothetical protein
MKADKKETIPCGCLIWMGDGMIFRLQIWIDVCIGYRVGVCYMLSEHDIMNGDIMTTTSKKVQT